MADLKHLSEDEKVLHGMGYAQELSRRMGPFQSFAISFAIICIISGGLGSFPIALSSGGPFSLTLGWIIGGIYALIIAASLGQIASAYPTAGSLYHWSSILGGRFWGWATAYVNLLGLLFVIPAVNVFLYFVIKDLWFAGVMGSDVSGWGTWTQIWTVVALTAAQCALNHFGISLTTKLTDLAGYLILGVTSILILMFLSNAVDFNIGRTFEFSNNTGAAGGGVVGSEKGALMAFLIGLLYPLFTITGFDASAHTSEETVDARNTVHKGMIRSVLWSLIFGFVLIVAMLLCIPDFKAAAAEGWGSFNNLFTSVILGSFLGKLMLIGIIIANFLCALAGVTSTSRMIYAFARDGGLPFSDLLSSVSPEHRTPNAAIWFTFILTSILVMITTPLGAFAALSTGCAMYLYISYAMPIVAGFFAEGKTWTEFGNFRLGGLSKLFGIITMIGTVLVAIAGHAFVPSISADAAAGTGFVPGLIWYTLGFAAFLGLLWTLLENRRFKGPPMGAEIARRQAEIAAREASLQGTSAHAASSYGGTSGSSASSTAAAAGTAAAVAVGASAVSRQASPEQSKADQAKADADRAAAAAVRASAQQRAEQAERDRAATAQGEAQAAREAQAKREADERAATAQRVAQAKREADAKAQREAAAQREAQAKREADAKAERDAAAQRSAAAARESSERTISSTPAKLMSDDGEAETQASKRTVKRASPAKKPQAKATPKAAPKSATNTAAKASAKTAVKRSTGSAGDDITLVDGIGPQLKKELAKAGIRSLADLSKLSATEIKALDAKIPRDADQIADWVSQAKDLLAGKAPRAASDRARSKS
jgi:amino acid transporter/predicted flap endonuclease-1-like 5' DNA nuclease